MGRPLQILGHPFKTFCVKAMSIEREVPQIVAFQTVRTLLDPYPFPRVDESVSVSIDARKERIHLFRVERFHVILGIALTEDFMDPVTRF